MEKIAIIVLNWNGQKFLEQFLPSVIKHSATAQIIVADNQSTDHSISYLKSHFPEVTIIQNPSNEGFAKGYNLALQQVKAEYYVLLNSDVDVTPQWLQPIIALMDLNKNIAACQPKILDYTHPSLFEYAGASGGFIDEYGYPFCRGRLFNHLEEDKNQYNEAIEVFWATGACMFIRSEAFWAVGGFDEDYFAHMEEIDLCWRLKNIGYQIYVEPKSIVYHVGGGTLHKLSSKKTYLNFRNNLTTFTKNAHPHFLFFKILFRMILDGVAAFKFLFEGKGLHFIAVIKAHGSFYSQLLNTLKKRKAIKILPNFKHTEFGIFKNSIVYLHFVKGIKTFSEIIKHT